MPSIVDYVEKLINIPSPTGFTKEIQNYLIENAKQKSISITHTQKGAVIYHFESNNKNATTLFSSHIDTLGAMVQEIKNREIKDQTVRFSPIGGYPPAYVIGNYCTIHTFDGQKISGTILPDNPAAHVNKSLKKDYKPDFSALSIRVDLKEDLNTAIEVGNFISFDPGFDEVNGFVKSRHLDDKASCAILLYLADMIVEKKIKLKKNVQFFFNISEETGQGIAGFTEEINDLIIIDMGVVGDGCNGDEFNVSICAKDSSGPYNYDLTQALINTAKEEEIGYKTDVFPFYGSDGSAILRSCRDMRIALLGPGVSASHGYERTHVDSLNHTQALIEAYISK